MSEEKAPAGCSSVLRERCVLPSDTFLAKGSASLDKLRDLCEEGKEHPPALLQLYTQVFCYGHHSPFQENVCRVWETVRCKKGGWGRKASPFLGGVW